VRRVFAFLSPAFFTVATIAAPRWEEMDSGPYPSSSVTMQYAKYGSDQRRARRECGEVKLMFIGDLAGIMPLTGC
jgi:hypothetical protein